MNYIITHLYNEFYIKKWYLEFLFNFDIVSKLKKFKKIRGLHIVTFL